MVNVTASTTNKLEHKKPFFFYQNPVNKIRRSEQHASVLAFKGDFEKRNN